MHNWFNVTVAYERTAEDGSIAKVKENYLMDALSFTEAEERISEEMKPYISGEFLIDKVTRARIAELFPNENGDRWYRCKVNFVTLDEERGIEKRTAATMLAQASSVNEAIEVLETGMKGTLADWELTAVSETNIMDIFTYKADK